MQNKPFSVDCGDQKCESHCCVGFLVAKRGNPGVGTGAYAGQDAKALYPYFLGHPSSSDALLLSSGDSYSAVQIVASRGSP